MTAIAAIQSSAAIGGNEGLLAELAYKVLTLTHRVLGCPLTADSPQNIETHQIRGCRSTIAGSEREQTLDLPHGAGS